MWVGELIQRQELRQMSHYFLSFRAGYVKIKVWYQQNSWVLLMIQNAGQSLLQSLSETITKQYLPDRQRTDKPVLLVESQNQRSSIVKMTIFRPDASNSARF